MTKRIRTRLALAALGLLLVHGVAPAQTKLLLSTFFSATHPIYTDVLVPWSKSVEAATQGRVRIEFAAASLAPPPGQLDMVLKGVADVTLQFAGVVPNRMPLELLTEIPGPVSDAATISRALWRTNERHFHDANEYKGLHLLGLIAFPPQQLFSVRDTYTSTEQLRAAKIATTPGTCARQYGAITNGVVAGPAVRFFETVSKGIVDAYAGVTPIDVINFNLAPSTRYAIRIPDLGAAAPFALVMSGRKWKEIQEADRAAIDSVSGLAFAALMRAMDRANDEAIRALTAGGVKFVDASAALAVELKKEWSFLEEEWIREAGRHGVDGAAALRFYRTELGSIVDEAR